MQVCLYSAALVADKHFGVVMFVDTCNSFSPKRIACIVDQLSSSFSGEVNSHSLPNFFCRLNSVWLFSEYQELPIS